MQGGRQISDQVAAGTLLSNARNCLVGFVGRQVITGVLTYGKNKIAGADRVELYGQPATSNWSTILFHSPGLMVIPFSLAFQSDK